MCHGELRLFDEVEPAVDDKTSFAAEDAAQEAVPKVVLVLVTGAAKSRINVERSRSFTKHSVARHKCQGRFCFWHSFKAR
jgi:hypothetical protein